MTSIFDKDLYAVLGVPSDASLREIRVARTRLLKRYHPDKGGDSDSDADREYWTSAAAEVNATWDVLKDARKRAEYDAYRSARARGGDEPSAPPPGPDSSPGSDRWRASGTASGDSASTSPPPSRRPPFWHPPLETAAAALLLFGALYSEACFHDSRITSEIHAAHAQRAAVDARRAAAVLSVADGRAREAARASREASSSFWAASWDLRKKHLALAKAGVDVVGRVRGLPFSAGAAAGGAGAAVAGAVSWLFSKIRWDPVRAAASWVKEVGAAAEVWAADMERRAAAGRLTREQRVAELRAAVDAAADVQDAARVVHAEAAAAADRAERRAEHARDVLSTTRSVAERAADRATDTAGDAAFARTFAAGAWVFGRPLARLGRHPPARGCAGRILDVPRHGSLSTWKNSVVTSIGTSAGIWSTTCTT